MSDHKSLSEALLAFQAEAPKLHKGETAKIPTKTGGSYTYKYVDYADIMDAIQPLLTKHGLTWSAFPTLDDGKPALRYKLAHAASKESDGDVMSLGVGAGDPQTLGSAYTYMRRYSLVAVLNLVADADDDGQRATRPPQKQQATPQNGSGYVNTEDISAIKNAAKGLTVRQIKLALGSIGASFPESGELFSMVPQDKATALAKVLAGTSRDPGAFVPS